MIDETKPEVQDVKRKMTQLLKLVREWHDRMTAMQNTNHTTEEEYREMRRVAVEMMNAGIDLAVPYMDDEEFPAEARKWMDYIIDRIPTFKEENGIQ